MARIARRSIRRFQNTFRRERRLKTERTPTKHFIEARERTNGRIGTWL